MAKRPARMALDARVKNLVLAADELKWITTHPNGKGINAKGEEIKGRPVLIETETGQIMSGVLTGRNISNPKKPAQSENKPTTGNNAVKQSAAKAVTVGLASQENSQATTPVTPPKPVHKAEIDLSLPPEIPKDVILQNRDRSSLSSQEQVEDIARNLDYFLVGTSNDFNTGCPVVSYGSYKPENFGRKTVLVTPKHTRLQVQYAVVDAGDVNASNNDKGEANERYYSRDPDVKRAIAGNGRLSGIQRAYKTEPTKAEQYKQELIENASDHGVDPDVIRGMKNPVLVRVMQPKDVTKDIGDQTNITQGATLSPVEAAHNDIKRVDVSKVECYADGSPTKDSVAAFIRGLPQTEQAGLWTKDKQPTRLAQDRLQNALMMDGYQSDYLVNLRGQAINPECKNMLTAFSIAAPAFAQLKGKEEYDVRKVLDNVATTFAQFRFQRGTDPVWPADMFTSQADNEIASTIGKALVATKASPRQMAEVLKSVATSLNQAYRGKISNTEQFSLLSEDPLDKDVKTPQQAVKEGVIKALSVSENEQARREAEKLKRETERNAKFNAGGSLLGAFGDALPDFVKAYMLGRAYTLGRKHYFIAF